MLHHYPVSVLLIIFGLFFLVACPPIGIGFLVLAAVAYHKAKGLRKEAHDEAYRAAVAKRDREIILAMKSLGR